MDINKLNSVIKDSISQIDAILEKSNIPLNEKSTLESVKLYLSGINSSKEEDIVIQQESIKSILKKINLKIKELEKA